MSDRTRPSDTRPDGCIIIVEAPGDPETSALMKRIHDLVVRDGEVLHVPLALPERHAELDRMMTKLLSLPAFVEMPPRRRKRKWRKPDEKGRR